MKKSKFIINSFFTIFILLVFADISYGLQWKYLNNDYYYFDLDKFYDLIKNKETLIKYISKDNTIPDKKNASVFLNGRILEPDSKHHFTKKIKLINGINIFSIRISSSTGSKVYYYCIPHNLPPGVLSNGRYTIYTNKRELKIAAFLDYKTISIAVFRQPFPCPFDYTTNFMFEPNPLDIDIKGTYDAFIGYDKFYFFYDRKAPVINYIKGSFNKKKRKLNLEIKITDPGIFVKDGSGIKDLKKYYLTLSDNNSMFTKNHILRLKRKTDNIFTTSVSINLFKNKTLVLTDSNIVDKAGNSLILNGDGSNYFFYDNIKIK